jgi:hypothetical protein
MIQNESIATSNVAPTSRAHAAPPAEEQRAALVAAAPFRLLIRTGFKIVRKNKVGRIWMSP